MLVVSVTQKVVVWVRLEEKKSKLEKRFQAQLVHMLGRSFKNPWQRKKQCLYPLSKRLQKSRVWGRRRKIQKLGKTGFGMFAVFGLANPTPESCLGAGKNRSSILGGMLKWNPPKRTRFYVYDIILVYRKGQEKNDHAFGISPFFMSCLYI